MGAGSSSPSLEGFHVIKVHDHSPGARAGLIPFFDFIVGARGLRLSRDDGALVQLIAAHDDKPLPLLVLNLRSATVREVVLVPTRNWPGEGLIGITIRFAPFERAFRVSHRVLRVFDDSPAHAAGLQAHTDYIVGAQSGLFTEEGELSRCSQACVGVPLVLLVYSSSTHVLREVPVVPDPSWGGPGCLGCELGTGALHAVPFTQEPGRSSLEDLTGVMGREMTEEDYARLAAKSRNQPAPKVSPDADRGVAQLKQQQQQQQQQQQPVATPANPQAAAPATAAVTADAATAEPAAAPAPNAAEQQAPAVEGNVSHGQKQSDDAPTEAEAAPVADDTTTAPES